MPHQPHTQLHRDFVGRPNPATPAFDAATAKRLVGEADKFTTAARGWVLILQSRLNTRPLNEGAHLLAGRLADELEIAAINPWDAAQHLALVIEGRRP